jgi:hypothetical protein
MIMAPIGKLFAGKTPKTQPVVRQPDQQDPAALEAQRKKRSDLIQGQGRASTDLTGAYASDRLGV